MTIFQSIIGTDKKNPFFSVCRHAENKRLYVFYGANVFEILEDKKDSPQLRFLAGRLYNAGVKAKYISSEFGFCFRSIKKWAKAIQNGTDDEILELFEGRHHKRKMTYEVESFVSFEFKRIFPNNKHSYSKEIRESIKQVFGFEISSESLRPIFTKLKNELYPNEPDEIDEFKKKI